MFIHAGQRATGALEREWEWGLHPPPHTSSHVTHGRARPGHQLGLPDYFKRKCPHWKLFGTQTNQNKTSRSDFIDSFQQVGPLINLNGKQNKIIHSCPSVQKRFDVGIRLILSRAKLLDEIIYNLPTKKKPPDLEASLPGEWGRESFQRRTSMAPPFLQ